MNIHPIIIADLEEIANRCTFIERLKNKRILITGASGFIGSYFVYFFAWLNSNRNFNIETTALLRNQTKGAEKFQNISKKDGLSFLFQDVAAPLPKSKKFDFIIHAASNASPRHYQVNPIGVIKANSVGTINLLENASQSNLESFLFISGGEVYGNLDISKFPTKETDFGSLDPMEIRSCYAESKRIGENICKSFKHQYGIPAKIARLFHTYGPGIDLNDGRVFGDFVSNVVNKTPLQIKSDGKATRSFCYISDAIEGLLLIMLKGENGEAYNLGNPDQEVNIETLANIIANLFPDRNISVQKTSREKEDPYMVSPFHRSCPNISKIKSLGWSPRTSIQVGFKNTINFYL